MLLRIYDNLDKWLQKGKVVIIYGPRRVGKTTLVNGYLKKVNVKFLSDSGDNINTRKILSSSDFSQILPYADQADLIFLDEAHLIPGVGQGLKIIVDQRPEKKIIATGSSSFDLAGQVGEPLVGRKWTLTLYPLSQFELRQNSSAFELKQRLAEYLIFGSYPEVLTADSREKKVKVLQEIANSYLFKDLLTFEGIRGSNFAHHLTQLLAFQIGNQVSLNELAQTLQVNIKTVQRYLDLLEKSFIIKSLTPFSRNLRDEIRSKKKYYFLDNGIRNAVISQFNDLGLRDDIGGLWENFLVSERIKFQEYTLLLANNFFWRTWEKKEVDWIEEREGKLFAYEFKWKEEKVKPPRDFLENYKESVYTVVNRENYLEFIS